MQTRTKKPAELKKVRQFNILLTEDEFQKICQVRIKGYNAQAVVRTTLMDNLNKILSAN